MALPIDRTALIAAQTNQVPNTLLRSALNISALTTPYDTIDELNNKVDANHAAGNTGTTQLADGSVTTAKHADLSVTTPKIAPNSVTLDKMADSSVGADELVNLSITNEKIANGVLTAAKFVAGALANETQNALRITELERQKTIKLNSDSFGVVGETTGLLFIDRVARYKNAILTNSAVNGSQVWDGWKNIRDGVQIPSTYDAHILNLGFNDARRLGDLPNVALHVKNTIKNMVAFLRLSEVHDNLDSSVTYTGTWLQALNPITYGTGVRYTTTQGDYCEFNVTGDKVTIGYFVWATSIGTMEIKVDGVVKHTEVIGNQSVSGALSASNEEGTYTNKAIELADLGSGSHTVRITKTDPSSADSFVFFDWWGIPSDNPPIVIVNGLTKMLTASYPISAPYDKASDAVMNSVNKAIRGELAGFGERVIFVDQSDFDPNNYDLILPDGSHPNNFGNEWIASNILMRWH